MTEYRYAHTKIRNLLGTPTECSECGKTGGPTTGYHWANLTGRFDDPEDYRRLCARCHFAFDGGRGVVERNRAMHRGEFKYEDGEWMRQRYEAGADLRDLAVEAGCAMRTIQRWMRIHGIAPRPRGHRRSDMGLAR